MNLKIRVPMAVAMTCFLLQPLAPSVLGAFSQPETQSLAANPYLLGYAGCASLAVFLLWQWNARLRREVSRRTQTLGRSEKILHAIQAASPIGIGILKDNAIDWHNEAISRMSGYDLEELRGQSPRMLYESEEEFKKAGARIADQLRLKDSANVETRWRRKDGGTFDCLLRYSPLELNDDEECVVVLAEDITGRNRHQAELRESQERLDLAIKGTGAGLWDWNLQTGRTVFSERWAQIVGYTLEDLEPVSIQTWIDLCHPDDLVTSNRELERHFAGQAGHYECETRMRHKNGEWVWVLDRGKVVEWDGAGAPLRMVGTHLDITAKKRMERQTHQVEKAESLGLVAGAIAHNFNNMLAAVIGNIELVVMDQPEDSQYRDKLGEALKAAKRAAEMSSFMSTYMGQLKTTTKVMDLSRCCDRAVAKLWGMMPGHIRLQIDFATPGLAVNIDFSQIQQVLTQLLNNAREAIGEGNGEIRISVHALQASDIEKGFLWPPDWRPARATYAALEVADTGCGIRPGDIGKVMDPFFSTKFIGRGLGLPTVLGISRAHGGAVTVRSQEGAGSVFQVVFPIVEQRVEAGEIIQDAAETAAFEANGPVLLVEDEEMVLKTTKALLERIGFDVLTARDGSEAVEIFHKHREDVELVLSDLVMPGMNGWDTLSAIRRIQPDIPVILTSGYNEAHAMAGEHLFSQVVFLQKPFEMAELKKAVAEALSPEF